IAQTARRRLTPEHYFKPRDEMLELFKDLPEALDSTIEIARRVSHRPRTRGPILPRFAALPGQSEEEGMAAEAQRLRDEAHAGLKRRFEKYGMAPGQTVADYETR